VAIHPNHQWIYAVNEFGGNNEKYEGAVSAFRMNLASKQFELLNTVPSHGNYPCHISVDKTGRFVMVANYGNGSVAIYPLKDDGSLSDASFIDQHRGTGPNPKRQEGPHAHMITQGADARIVYNTDLGTDKIFVYKLDTINGKLLPTDVNYSSQPGAGPRHLVFHPNQKWAYCVNELIGTIEASLIDKTTGALTRFQTISTLPEGEKREPGSADIHITPNGKFLYATNRGDINTIAMFTIHQKNGKLQLLGHQSTKGKTPRNFVIDPTGTFLLVANQNTNNVITFRIDPTSGKLKETGIETEIPSPVCLKFVE
jgi:6-phosphogluconolactonase